MPARVREGERVRHLGREPQCLVDRQPLTLRQQRAERWSLDVRHDVVGRRHAFDLDDAGVDDAENVGMVELRDDADLAGKALGPGGSAEFRAQQLDGDQPVVLEVAREPHRGHAPLAQRLHDVVAAREGRVQLVAAECLRDGRALLDRRR